MIISIYDFDLFSAQITIETNQVMGITIKEEDFKSLDYIKEVNKSSTNEEKDFLKETIKQIEEYLNGKRKTFDLNLYFKCSDFSKRVYEAVINTEYGKVYRYKDIAKLANSPKAFRAVGTCMKKNPFAIVVPCHRVVKSEENVGNYFLGGDLKQNLINIENKNK